MRTRRPSLLAALLLLLPAPLAAQALDPVFHGWRFRPEPLPSRPAGLAGATVGIADSVTTAVLNPAGIGLVPSAELGLSTRRLWTGVAFRHQRLALAVYGGRREQASQGLDDLSFEAARFLRGQVERDEREIGVALASSRQPAGLFRYVHAGLTVAHRRLDLRAEHSSFLPGGGEERRTVIAGDGNAVLLRGGLIVDSGDDTKVRRLRVGLVWSSPYEYELDRQVLDAGGSSASRVHIRTPTVLSTGASLRWSDRVLLAGQVDLVRRREVLRFVPGLDISGDPDWRFAVELTQNLPPGGTLKLRGGWARLAPATLRYGGADALLRAAFPATEAENTFSAGLSLLAEYFGPAIRMDLDVTSLQEEFRVSTGLTVRF